MVLSILVAVIVVIALVMLLTKATPLRAEVASAGRATSGGILTSFAIFVLRVARGLLALMTVFAGLMACKFLLFFGVSANTGTGDSQTYALLASLLAGIGVVLFWTSAKIRNKVNQMYFERSNTTTPLLAGYWSL